MTTEKDNGLYYSLIFHSLLLATVFIKSTFFSGPEIPYQSAIRVDIVGLPDKINPETQITPATQTPEVKPDLTTPSEPIAELKAPAESNRLPDKQAPKVEDAIKLDSKKTNPVVDLKKQKEAFDKIKKLSALEKIKNDVASSEIKKMAGLSDSKPKQFKGNILNAGTELTGINKIQHEDYVSLIDRKIKENWTLPQWLSNKDFKAQALMKLDENGNIIYNQIYKSSGNANYDDIVLETILKSGPFPKPPEKFTAILYERGVVIGFPE